MTHVLGRATTDVELLTSKKDKTVKYCKVPIAVNQKKKDEKGNEIEEVCFYDILIFGKPAESAAERIKKGDLVTCMGKPDVDAYLSKSGEAKYSFSILAELWQVIK